MTYAKIDDGMLLAEFAASGQAAPFEELVRRHAPVVFNVCHRVLNQSQDTEDAAQAVFLTLANKAKTLHARSLRRNRSSKRCFSDFAL